MSMLTTEEISELQALLPRVQAQSHDRLELENEMFHSYGILLHAYQRLSERYQNGQRFSHTTVENSYVLVLLDLDSHIFQDELLSIRGGAGGAEAARLLRATVAAATEQLRPAVHESRIILRGYTNLAGLSRKLAKHRLTGNEARSLAPFMSAIIASDGLFDIADSGDTEHAVAHKIAESFRFHAEDSRCRHIFFGACHDARHTPMLSSFRSQANRVTLIKGPCFHSSFEDLDLSTIELTSVFRGSSLPTRSSWEAADARRLQTTRAIGQSRMREFEDDLGGVTLVDSFKHRGAPPAIPRDRHGRRIDPPLSPPSQGQIAAYNSRISQGKLCNKYHLSGDCPLPPEECPYDHSYITAGVRDALRWFARTLPCPNKGACYWAECHLGHMCVREGCNRKKCRFSKEMHDVERELVGPV